MHKLAIVALAAMVALNAGAPAFAKEVCHEVKVPTLTCKGSSTDKHQVCTQGSQTAQVCKQVPDTTTGGKAAVGGVQAGATSSPSSKNAMTGAKMSRLNQ
jgi:hypothetical protein